MNDNGTELFEIIKKRHSVRRFTDRKIDEETSKILSDEIASINCESGLFFSLVIDEPEAFKAGQPSYGSFKGCRNYFVLCGKKGDDEKIGYYGEKLVLLSTSLGLGSCWVALTFERKKVPVEIPAGMKLFDVIALGYGENEGQAHRSKDKTKISNIKEGMPDWFKRGVEAALLAPTAINQQRFYLEYIEPDTVRARALIGPCSKTDLGIVKYHFEIAAGKENFKWEE